MIGFDLCPFARRPNERGQVRWVTLTGHGDPLILAVLSEVAFLLEADPDQVSTTLVLTPTLTDYEEFLDAVGAVDAVLEGQGAGPLVQVLAFHPDAVYADADPDDPANAAARSPVPVIHLLRADEVQRAVAQHPDAAGLSERNADRLRARAATSSSREREDP